MVGIENLNYAQRQRLQFIESVALWEGIVGRQRVSRIFDVSENHITRDFALYRKSFPGNLDYDVSARAYRPGKGFKPHIGSGSPEEYLALLRAHLETHSVAILPGIGQGDVAAVCLPAPNAPLNDKVLREITRALHQGHGVKVKYQSLRSPAPVERVIWPHALVFAGVRWHIRAYDSKHGHFGDFTLHRILSATPVPDTTPVSVDRDVDWHEVINIDIRLADTLTDTQKDVLIKEYGMELIGKKWVWRVPLKRCLVSYFLRWLRLDLSETKSYPICLVDPGLAKTFRFDDD
jgi:predicted DNA-binding transcriptional regulator YafY